MTRSSVEMLDASTWREAREALRRFIAARIAKKADADDLVQDVIERALAKIQELRDHDRFYPWLYTICRNTITTRRERLVSRRSVLYRATARCLNCAKFLVVSA